MAEITDLSESPQNAEKVRQETPQFWAQFAVQSNGVASSKGDDGDTYDTKEIGVTDYGTC